VRLFAGDPDVKLQNPPPVLNGSAGLGNGYAPKTASVSPQLPMTLRALKAGVHVQVRDGDGALVYDGDLAIGQSKQLAVDPPVTVVAVDGAALSLTLAGHDMGSVGTAPAAATKVYQRPAGLTR
jgi:hypothetical protein